MSSRDGEAWGVRGATAVVDHAVHTPYSVACQMQGPERGLRCLCKGGPVDDAFEAVGVVGDILLVGGLLVILMGWGGMDERMPTQIPPRRFGGYAFATGALLLVVAAVGRCHPPAAEQTCMSMRYRAAAGIDLDPAVRTL